MPIRTQATALRIDSYRAVVPLTEPAFQIHGVVNGFNQPEIHTSKTRLGQPLSPET
jgi:hypothetical protein